MVRMQTYSAAWKARVVQQLMGPRAVSAKRLAATVGVRDGNFDRSRLSIRRARRPRERRQTGGGLPADAIARLVGRATGRSSWRDDANGDRSDVPSGLPPTPQVPASSRGVGGGALMGLGGRAWARDGPGGRGV